MKKSPGRDVRRKPGRHSRVRRWPLFLAALGFVVLATLGREFVTGLLVRSYLAESGRMENTVDLRGYLLWQEQVLVAPVTGELHLRAADGERVRSGAVVAELRNSHSQVAIEREIAQAEQHLAHFLSQASGEAVLLRERLAAQTQQLAGVAQASRQLSGAQQVAVEQQELQQLVSDRAEQRAQLDQLEETEALLREELASARAQRAEAQQAVVAPLPGVVVHALDGLEEALAWGRMDRLTPRILFTLSGEPLQRVAGERVAAGAPVAKLLDMREVVWAAAAAESKVSDVIRGMRVVLRWGEGVQVQGTVLDVRYGAPPGYAIILVSMREGAEQLGRVRPLEVTLVKTAQEGIRVPQSALWQEDGRIGVFVVHRTMIKFQPVEVLLRRGTWALVLGLAAGDEVIITPRWVKDGQRAH